MSLILILLCVPAVLVATTPPGDGACAKPLVGVALGGTDNLPSSFPVGKANGTVAVCCQACDHDPACQSWTLNLAMDPPSCWLKATRHAGNHGKNHQGVTSGIKPAAPVPPCKGRLVGWTLFCHEYNFTSPHITRTSMSHLFQLRI